MKLRSITWLVVVILAFLRSASGQSFTNLNFEKAKIVVDPSSGYYPYDVYASQALPGWTIGGNFQGTNDIFYNEYSLGATSVQLFGTNLVISPPPLDGHFSIDLYGGVTDPSGASISQTGLVPASAMSLQFIAEAAPFSDVTTLLVSLGGQNLSLSVISTGPNYTLYGGDISAFANQVEPLTFTAPEGVNNSWEIDDIQFSTSPIPEPNALAFFGLGVLSVGLRRFVHSS